MDRKELFKSIDSGQICPVYCFYGPEAYVRKQAERKLMEKLLTPGMEMMNLMVLTDPEVSQIIENCEVLPFMGDRRLVIVRELALLGKETGAKEKAKGKEGAESKGKEKTDASDELIQYLKRMPESTCLLLDAGEGFDKRKKLGKAIAELPGCVEFQMLEDAELQRWIAKTAKGMEASIEKEAGERLVFLSGRDLTTLSSELMKLSAYVGKGGTIRGEDVDRLATRTSEARVFEMIEALFDGKTEAAFSQTDTLLLSGESRLGILALITRQIRQMLFAVAMTENRRNSGEIAKTVGINSYFLGKTVKKAKTIGTGTLKACLERCISTDYDIKRGVLREETGFDRLMLEMAQIATRRNSR